MDKVYSRINWQNQPNTATALGATNLNKMDTAINTIDDRVITLDTSKASIDTVNGMVKDVSLNPTDGVITVTYQNGTTTTYDTKLEKLAVNFGYDVDTEQLIITLDDGTIQYIDLSALITQYNFQNSSTVGFTVTDGNVKAEIPDGSIGDEKLESGYLAAITVQAQTATTQAALAKRYAVGGVEEGDTTDNAKYYKEQAEAAAAEAEEIVGFDPTTKMNKANVDTATEGQVLTSNGDGTAEFKDPHAGSGNTAESTVAFTEAITDADIASGDTHATLFGKIKKRFSVIATALASKFDKANIIHTTTVNDAAKVPSSAVTCSLAQQISAMSDTLGIQTGTWTPTVAGGGVGTVTGTAQYYKIGKFVHISGFIYITMSSVTADQLRIGGLPFTPTSIRYIIPMGYATLPSIANHFLEGVSSQTYLGFQPIGTNGSYAGSSLTVGTSYIAQFSGEYMC